MSSSEDPRYAQVALNLPLRRNFDYAIPEPIRSEVAIGKRVLVPFGKRKMVGYCVGLVDEPEVAKTKDIIQVVDHEPMLDAKMLELTRWMANYYHCSWGEALEAALPSGVRHKRKMRRVSVPRLCNVEGGIEACIEKLRTRSPKQARILQFLSDHPEAELSSKELGRTAGASIATIRALEKRELIYYEKKTVEAYYPDEFVPVPKQPAPELTRDQGAACARIEAKLRSGEFGVTLLLGITGSGKTEVYLRAIQTVLELGRTAIVLVPEISLTPQTIRRFKERFDNVSVLHSHLTGGQSSDHWTDLRLGKSCVVVGARSAIFAPVQNLGLVVIDEEHENSFKQDNAPRYHARDAAIMRAQGENALVILGSATPSLESYYNAQSGKFEILHLPRRIGNRPLPPVRVVDLRLEVHERRGYHTLSRLLEKTMREALDAGRQVILFLNRRGHSPYINCRRCGFVLKCHRCDIALTFHQNHQMAICHYCNSEVLAPSQCPDCGVPGLNYFGLGTQKVEEEVQQKFPGAVCARMDSDTTRGRGSHERILSDFLEGQVQILLGTQMIAKGLDFPNVTVVGVVAPDIGLALPDFRATERTFQLVAQVAGRAGRGDESGRVIVQTSLPEHYSIQRAARHDYLGFAKEELAARQPLSYPPFGRMVRFLLSDRDQAKVQQAGQELVDALRSHVQGSDAQVVGPAPAPIAQIKHMFRWQILVRAAKPSTLHRLLRQADRDLANVKPVKVTVDVDPLTML